MRFLGRLVSLVLLAGSVSFAADRGSDESKVIHRQPPVLRTVDGAAVFQAYCSSCHGPAAKGDGPAARHLETPVPDLTRLEQRDGELSHWSLVRRIAGRGDRELHVMPVWESILERTYSDPARQSLMLHNLARYVESIQVREIEPAAGS